MNAAPTSVPISSAGKGPSGPWRCSASRDTSASKANHPAHQLTNCAAELGVGPPSRDHLLEHPHVSGVQVIVKKVAGPLVALPQGRNLGVHILLAGEAALTFVLQQRKDEALLGTEVIVQLTQRHSGLFGNFPC
jgi:hypothetical protein